MRRDHPIWIATYAAAYVDFINRHTTITANAIGFSTHAHHHACEIATLALREYNGDLVARERELYEEALEKVIEDD